MFNSETEFLYQNPLALTIELKKEGFTQRNISYNGLLNKEDKKDLKETNKEIKNDLKNELNNKKHIFENINFDEYIEDVIVFNGTKMFKTELICLNEYLDKILNLIRRKGKSDYEFALDILFQCEFNIEKIKKYIIKLTGIYIREVHDYSVLNDDPICKYIPDLFKKIKINSKFTSLELIKTINDIFKMNISTTDARNGIKKCIDIINKFYVYKQYRKKENNKDFYMYEIIDFIKL